MAGRGIWSRWPVADFDRASRQAQFFARSADRSKTGAVQTGVHELANAGEADAPTKRASDHRQACCATIHLVDLLDEGHASTAVSLDEVAAFSEWRIEIGLVDLVFRLIDLGIADGLLRRSTCGQQLLIDVGRNVGDVAGNRAERSGRPASCGIVARPRRDAPESRR